jgi:hypothetical protein
MHIGRTVTGAKVITGDRRVSDGPPRHPVSGYATIHADGVHTTRPRPPIDRGRYCRRWVANEAFV